MDGGLDEDELSERLTRYKGYVEDYLSNTVDHRERAREAYRFRHGKQWTSQEQSVVEARGEPALTFNLLGPKIGSMLGAEVVGRTDPKAVGRNPGKDMEAADIATAILRYLCDRTKWSTERSLCRESYYVQGVMGAEICADEEAKPGRNRKITIKHIPYDRLFWDPHSSFADFRDAKYYGSVLWQDIDDVRATFKDNPKALDVLDNYYVASEDTAVRDEELDDRLSAWIAGTQQRRRIRVSTIWVQEEGEWTTATYCGAGFLEEPRTSPYVDPDGVPQPGLVLQSCYVRDENERYGVALALMDPQREFNKRRSKALHLMNTKTVIADEGAVADVSVARNELHKASGWITKRKGLDVQLVDHEQQIVDNLTLMRQASDAFETIGPSESLMGQASPSASGKSIEVRQRSALLKYGDVLDGARQWELRVYEQLWYRAVQYLSEEDYIRVTDDPNAPKFLGINIPKPVTRGEMMVRGGMKPAVIEQLVRSGQMPMQAVMEQVAVEKENDLTQMDVDIILDTGPDSTSAREQQIENFMSLLGQVGPQLPPKTLLMAIEIVVELSPIDSRLKKRFLDSMKPSEEEQAAAAQQAQQQEQLQQQAAMLAMQQAQAEVGLTKAKTDKEEASADKLMAEAALTARSIGVEEHDNLSTGGNSVS